jgi:TolB-like protein/DNA-binding winged helix-turn-helix (wHTH) protein/Flp pilus assembly protein TadD
MGGDMAADVVRFGDDLELDRVGFELRRSGQGLKLERIPLEILFLLVERRGQLVGRDDIVARVWGKDVFVDTDNSINSAIRKIRNVLKDDSENPLYVQTVTGKGYRFIAAVTEAGLPSPPPIVDGEKEPEALEIESDPVTPPPNEKVPRRSNWIIPLGALVLLLALGVSIVQMRARSHPAAAPPRVMLAVLPFVNLSNDPGQEYFSDGLTEETITDLGEVNPEQLGVIARTSSTAYKNTNKSIAQIGQELGVDYVLEGSVRRDGGAARISAQLIRVKDQTHLWAHNYDRQTGGLLALQDELGRAIAQQVQVRLTPPYGNRPARNYAANPEAYELYLKGRFYMNKRTEPEMTRSAEYFQQAIDKDPAFALAYAGLADSYFAQGIESQRVFDPKAKEAASRALELDEDLAEAHTVLGAVKADFEYDWPGAEREFKRAIELDPNYADAHYRYAWDYLTPLGKSSEAIAEMKKALELDPFSRIDNTVYGLTYYYARRYDEAREQFNKAIELNPDFFVTYYHSAWLYSQLGQYENAITALTKGRLVAGGTRAKFAASEEASLRKAFAAEGTQGFWQEILRHQEADDDPEVGEFDTPQAYARLGNKEKALQGLERNYEEREPLGTLVNVDPAFDSLHSDPRFQDLVRRMGIASSGRGQ